MRLLLSSLLFRQPLMAAAVDVFAVTCRAGPDAVDGPGPQRSRGRSVTRKGRVFRAFAIRILAGYFE